jgi:WD repeat-containing protein 22
MQNTCKYLASEEMWNERRKLQRFLSSRLAYAHSLFHKDLKGHFSCVNAIEFSKRDQAHLISAGDDKRILVWSLHDHVLSPQQLPSYSRMNSQHNSNVLTLAWDNEDQRVFSGGNDHAVIVHQVETYFSNLYIPIL